MILLIRDCRIISHFDLRNLESPRHFSMTVKKTTLKRTNLEKAIPERTALEKIAPEKMTVEKNPPEKMKTKKTTVKKAITYSFRAEGDSKSFFNDLMKPFQ